MASGREGQFTAIESMFLVKIGFLLFITIIIFIAISQYEVVRYFSVCNILFVT